MSAQPRLLLDHADPPPVRVVREEGSSSVLLLGDHAGNAVPASLGGLGLSVGDRARHIAWDLGVLALGEELAAALDATFIWQPFSRLVIDCNRDPLSEAAILEVSDETRIAGNAALDEAAREQRREAIHAPYHRRIADEIAARRAVARTPVLVALHSFTPVLGSRRRPWEVGILHDAGDVSLSLAVLNHLKKDPTLMVGDNEPYRMDNTDYTIPKHGYPNALRYLEVEFRQDLLAHTEGTHWWAARLARCLLDVL